jgi:D-tyrosyl-tRNA(Tyr) deacylase
MKYSSSINIKLSFAFISNWYIVKGVLNVKLCEEEGAGSGTGDSAERESKGDVRDTALKRDVDLLIIPQATLGGKLKGKSIQYHGLVTKSHGEDLFAAFVEKVKGAIQGNVGAKGKVESGVYGARQILKMETNGPFTHVFDF